MKRKLSTLLFGALAVFAFMPVSVSANCVATDGTVYGCGAVVTKSCTFTADLDCSNTFNCAQGLIIDKEGITIDGAGYRLIGPADDQCCPVLMTADGSEPEGQPCRVAAYEAVGQNGTGLNSGIYNALDARVGGRPTVGGCGATVVGQSKCDNLTVKNLEITGWCDGIFASGTIDPNNSPANDDLLDGQEFEHNVIHHNGDDCETCFNDGIFTAMIGVADENYPNNSSTPINKPGVYSCTVDEFNEEGELVQQGNTTIISNNNIWSQHGRGVEAGPGGNGINLQGGVEFDIEETNPIRYSSCVEVHNNAIMKTRLSGIMLTHALEGVEMYKNDIEYAEYGGITIPCDFVKFNTIEHNVIIKCAGVGIGVFDGTHITGNVVKDTVKGLAHFSTMGFPNAGDGILVNAGGAGKVGNTSDLQDNISCFSFDRDIKVVNGNVIGCGDNQCCKTDAAADSCHRWNCACFASDADCNDPGFGAAGWSDWKKAVSGDVNNSGIVTPDDRKVLYDVWNSSFTNLW